MREPAGWQSLVQGTFEEVTIYRIEKKNVRIKVLDYTKLVHVLQSNNLSVIFSNTLKLFVCFPDKYINITCNFVDSGPLIMNR